MLPGVRLNRVSDGSKSTASQSVNNGEAVYKIAGCTEALALTPIPTKLSTGLGGCSKCSMQRRLECNAPSDQTRLSISQNEQAEKLEIFPSGAAFRLLDCGPRDEDSRGLQMLRDAAQKRIQRRECFMACLLNSNPGNKTPKAEGKYYILKMKSQKFALLSFTASPSCIRSPQILFFVSWVGIKVAFTLV